MTTKAEYLKKYLDSTEGKKKKKRIKKRSNLAVHDDDVDWRSLQPVHDDHSDKEDDLEEAPLVAEFKDDSVRKWQPVSSKDQHSDRNRIGRNTSGQSRSRMDSPDFSPLRRQDLSDDDLSPPRRKRSLSPDLSPPRRSPSPDLSPPRRKRPPSPDLSPPRERRRLTPDLSPPRRGTTQNKRNPEREPRISSRDQKRRPQSPNVISSRLKQQDSDLDDYSQPKRRKRWDSIDDDDTQHSQTQIRMVSGKETDVRSDEELKQTAKNKQETYYQKSNDEVSGQHAETVYRDKEGRKIDPKLEKLKKKQEERMMQEENDKFMSWGRGVAQIKTAKEKINDELYEMSKPLARYADDEDLERMLKEREREGDPMLAFIKKKTKRIQSNPLTGKPKKEKPAYKGSAPPNRFGIRPGYRWDGVDRSNGFEKAWFSRESNKKAFDEEAYKWSVEDM